MNKFKDFISTRRKELKMTQRELAEKLNVSDKTISKWENGISYPEITLLATIAKVLDVDVRNLLGVEDLQEKKVEEDLEKNQIITQYKNKFFITIALLIIGIFISIVSIFIEDVDLKIIILTIGILLLIIGLIYFIYNNNNFRRLYCYKFYRYDYDVVYAKYSFITISILVTPALLFSIFSNQMLNTITVFGIINLTAITFIIASTILIFYIYKKANFKIKNDLISILLLVSTFLIFILMLFNILRLYFLPLIYILLVILINRKEYINDTNEEHK